MPGLDTEDKSMTAKDNVYRIRGKATDWEEIYIYIYIYIYLMANLIKYYFIQKVQRTLKIQQSINKQSN